MIKFNIIFLYLFFIITLLYGESINKYKFIPVKTIPVGKEEGLIGWQPAIAGGFSGPTAFCITNKNMIYVPDRVNFRLNVYDISVNFIRTVIEENEKNVHFALNLKIDNSENIYYSFSDLGLIKINNNGKLIYKINYINLSDEVKSKNNYFPINDKLFIYNSNNDIEYINNAGSFVETKEAKQKLEEYSIEDEKMDKSKSGAIHLPDPLKEIITKLRKDPKNLIVNDKYYSTSYYKTMEYFEKIKAIRKYVIAEKERLYGHRKKVDINLDNYSLHFIDYDDDHNGYWEAIRDDSEDLKSYAIVVFSKYGELLDVFYYGQFKRSKKGYLAPFFENYPASGAEVAIAPNGDVYFMVGNEKEYTFYKVKRAW